MFPVMANCHIHVHSRAVSFLHLFFPHRIHRTSCVQELVHEHSMGKLYKWLAIGAIFMMVFMIAALTGMTYGIVRLLKDTRVAENNFIVVKSSGSAGQQDSAALMGSAAMNLSSATVNLADEGWSCTYLAAS
jgi:hypothetical protein